MKTLIASALLAPFLLAAPALSGPVEIVDARAAREGAAWRFDVTLRHDDQGWAHYANAWRVVGPDGTVYGQRTLLHPHEGGLPFTRSLAGVVVPEGVAGVLIEARDTVHGWSPSVVELPLPR